MKNPNSLLFFLKYITHREDIYEELFVMDSPFYLFLLLNARKHQEIKIKNKYK